MSSDLLGRARAEHPRPPPRLADLYAPADWALVRAPLLPADAADVVGRCASGASLLPDDARARAAIGIASADLTAALARARPGDRKEQRLRGKLLRYLIRMSTRPTPYGLFAGVGLVGWGPETTLALGPESPRTRTRPDMEWLLDLVASLERDPRIRARLRLVTSSEILLRGGRAFLTGGSGPTVSVRATAAVRRALELARVAIPPAALARELSTAPDATPERAARLVEELWRQGFLLLDLRPPLTGGDPASDVLERLAVIPAARRAAEGLAELLDEIRAWDLLEPEERAAASPGLLARVRALHPAPPSANLLQTDMALPLTDGRIHAALGAEAAHAAELLLRVSPFPRGLPHLDAYRRAFESRYGRDRDVPLLEVVDADFGLGPPEGHGWDGLEPELAARRDRLLRDLALDALRTRRLAVELDDELLGKLETWTPRADTAPPSLDISLFVAASSPTAIDAGDFRVVVGPNLGAGAAGRNLGRFADLLGPRARAALARIARDEIVAAPGRIVAEVVYMPQRARSANVAIRPAVRAWEVVFGTPPGVAHERVVPAGELVVGLRAGRFVIRWPARDAEVLGMQGHMLNPQHAPAAARFLLDVASDGRCQLSSFQWGAAAGFPFLPRVERGRIILGLAQWRIDPVAGELPPERSDIFGDALSAWRERWSAPRHVYLAAGDNRLLLDLEDPDHGELLRSELLGLPEGHTVLLQEALPGPAQAWLPGADGGHIAELVVPLILRGPSTSSRRRPEAPRRAHGPVSDRLRLRPPGSDWLYLKLYAPRAFEDELISGPLRSFAEFTTRAGLADGWFFLRYADPDPHLRVRFHGEPATLVGPLMEQLCGWAGDLVADGVCTGFAFDTYHREVERYGGEEAMRAAEMIFIADSPAVAGMLSLIREDVLPFDAVTLAVLSIDALLDSLGLDTGARVEVHRSAAPSLTGGRAYRARQRELRALLGQPLALAGPPGDDTLGALLAARRAALAPAAALLGSLERAGLLDRPLAQLCQSYIHLHVNRLLAPSGPNERLAVELLRRTREGLERSPVSDREDGSA
jgi:lantibiotic biosynthesis protein